MIRLFTADTSRFVTNTKHDQYLSYCSVNIVCHKCTDSTHESEAWWFSQGVAVGDSVGADVGQLLTSGVGVGNAVTSTWRAVGTGFLRSVS